MGDFEKQIKEITGLDEKEFIKLFKDRDKEWTTGMKHVEEHGLRSIRMVNGEEQWDPKLAQARIESNRPMLSENLLPDFVNKPHGEFCMTTPQAVVQPVDGEGDQKIADVLKGLIYHTSYQSSGTAVHRDAFYALVSSSLGAWKVKTRFVSNDSWNVEPKLELIQNPFTVRWDLTAKEPDLSDKKWTIILATMEEAEYIKEYGKDKWRPQDWSKSQGADKELWWSEKKATVAEVWWIQEDKFTLYELPDGTTSREKPSTDVDTEGNKLRSRESADLKVWSCVISPTEVLTEPTEWPDYTDNPLIPIVIVHGRKLIIAGKIYFKSIVSDGLDIQQLHNYWITANTEALALQPDAPYIATDAQIAGFDEWTDISKKVRVMRYKVDPKLPAGSKPTRESPPQLSNAMMNMPQYTRQALRDVIGLHQASLGMQGNEKSGLAIQKRKQEGDAGKYSFIENITRGIELEAKIQINILPSIMDAPRIERIMGEDGTKSLAYIKQKNPETGETLDLSVGKYDAHVTTGPTFATQRDEARDLMIQLVQYLGPIAPLAVQAIAPKFVKLINAPDADIIAKIIISTLPPAQQAFYASESDDKDDIMKKVPPEILNQLQLMGQQLQQAQQLLQQQGAELESLKKEEAFKMKELELRTGLDKEKLAIEREKIVKEMTLKREEMASKKEIELEKINANIELRLTELMETFKAQKELKEYASQLEPTKAPAPAATVPATPAPTQTPEPVAQPNLQLEQGGEMPMPTGGAEGEEALPES